MPVRNLEPLISSVCLAEFRIERAINDPSQKASGSVAMTNRAPAQNKVRRSEMICE